MCVSFVHRMTVITILTCLFITALAFGGRAKDVGESVHTVEWFKVHKAERDAMMATCGNNPGQLAATPNCMNATQAANLLKTDLSKPSGMSTMPSFDPCTADENKHLPHCQKKLGGTVPSEGSGK